MRLGRGTGGATGGSLRPGVAAGRWLPAWYARLVLPSVLSTDRGPARHGPAPPRRQPVESCRRVSATGKAAGGGLGPGGTVRPSCHFPFLPEPLGCLRQFRPPAWVALWSVSAVSAEVANLLSSRACGEARRREARHRAGGRSHSA